MYILHLKCNGEDYITELSSSSAISALMEAVEDFILEGEGQSGTWEFVKLEKVE